MPEPNYRRPLNAQQQDILLILYKFRFATVDLIAQYLELKSRKYTYTRVDNLVAQKYIGKQFSDEDKINRKPAVFYLLPEGMKAVKAFSGVSAKALPNAYRDNRRSPAFIERSLMALRLHNKLRQLYNNNLEFYSKTELQEYDFFPKNLPDCYLLIQNKPYMLDWLPATSTTYQATRSRVDQFIRHYASETWSVTEQSYPTVLFICDNPYIERQTQRIARRSTYKAIQNEEIEEDGLTILTSTTKAIFSAPSKDVPVWSNVEDPEEPVVL